MLRDADLQQRFLPMTAVPKISLAACALSAWLAAPAAAMNAGFPLPPSPGRPETPVLLDPGHGGDDLGAIAGDLQEKEIALSVALRLRRRLQGLLPVAMTREDDRYVTLDRRVVDAVDYNAAAFISIHLNKIRDRRQAGAVVYSYAPPTHRRRWRRRHPSVPPMPSPPRVETRESARLAGAVVYALRRAGVSASRDRSDYYVLKNPASPSVLVEIGYLSNRAEARRLGDPAYQEKIAQALARAIYGFAADRTLMTETAAAALPPAPRL